VTLVCTNHLDKPTTTVTEYVTGHWRHTCPRCGYQAALTAVEIARAGLTAPLAAKPPVQCLCTDSGEVESLDSAMTTRHTGEHDRHTRHSTAGSKGAVDVDASAPRGTA
jgi:hypothetical protein